VSLLLALLGWLVSTSVTVIEVHGTVDETLAHHVKRSLAEASQRTGGVIVLDVDTWGGELESAFEISDAITSVSCCSTVTYVRRKAISAGALIGLSAQSVYMAPGATLGDCAPIISTEEGPHFLGEKIESPLRARFRALARRHGLPLLLAEKMVTKDLEVVEAIDTAGRRDYYTTKNFGELVGDKRQGYVSWKILVADGQLLTVDDAEAKDLGISRGTYASLDSLCTAKGWTRAKTSVPSWSENYVRWMADWSSLLLLVGLACLWIEYKSPGGFVFGLLGFLALGLSLGSKYALGLSGHEPLLLAGIGMVLFLLEVWLLPGTMVPGMLGILCLLAALTMSMQGFLWPSNPAQLQATFHSLGLVMGCLAGGFFLSLLTVRYLLPAVPVREGLRLDAALSKGNGLEAGKDYTGLAGVAFTALRPRGSVEVNGERIEAHCLAGYLEEGTPVKVVLRSHDGWIVERA
jgi:membrane-bound serine protease (ClpP class)